MSDQLNSNPGFFRLGAEAIAYGRSTFKPIDSPAAHLPDVLAKVYADDGCVVLPFDPNEVISNFHLERYVRRSQSIANRLAHWSYYAMRPALPVSVRRYLQRARLRKARVTRFPRWPLDWTADQISEQLLALSLSVRAMESTPFVAFWPDGVRSCAIMTHDVETETGLEFCTTLMDIDDSYAIKSSFQLVPEDRYLVTEDRLADFRARGFEVNVHDLNHDGQLYHEERRFRDRAKKINEYARAFAAQGFRSGAMYRNPDWYDAFELVYDMSFPTAGHLEAQAGGCCTLRPYFINELVELPLTTTQDYSLFHILVDYSIELWRRQIDAIVERGGLISFIVHPDYIIGRKARAVYEALLAHLARLRDEGKIAIPLPREIAEWWKQRKQMKLVRQDDKWNIEGSGSERARISHAHVDKNGCLYY